MTDRNGPVLAWPDGPAKKNPEKKIRVERFKPGVARVIVMLGDVVSRAVHWDRETRSSVPCFKPSDCPLCKDPKWVRTARVEGYAPVLVKNERLRQWEQAVAVLTAGGLDKLGSIAPPPYRGRSFMIQKCQVGTSTPMKIEERPALPEEFPALPDAFSVKAVMMRIWFPLEDHLEPIVTFDPIPIEQRPKAQPVQHATMELDPAMIEQLRLRGHHKLADKYAQELHEQEQGKIKEAIKAAGLPKANPTPVHYTAAEERMLLTQGTAEILCREVKNRVPATHPIHNGKPKAGGEGGVK